MREKSPSGNVFEDVQYFVRPKTRELQYGTIGGTNKAAEVSGDLRHR
jgi:hypothetical protein